MLGTIGNVFRMLILLSCFIALIFQFINTASCRFVYKASEQGDKSIDMGLYKMGFNEECVGAYPEDLHENDGLLSGARSCNITSMIAAAIAMAMIAIEFLKCKIPCSCILINIILTAAWVNALCVYMVFGMEGCGNYFHGEELQGKLNNMTAVADLMEKMDSNPKTDFSLNNNLRTKLDGLSEKSVNVTELLPAFIEDIPFGTDCSWGSGATFNLIAALVYFACGLLLCFTPRPAPIWSRKEDESGKGGTDLSNSGHFDTSPSARIV